MSRRYRGDDVPSETETEVSTSAAETAGEATGKEGEVATQHTEEEAILDFAKACQAHFHPEAPDGDPSPYMEDAHKFFAMASKLPNAPPVDPPA